MRRIEADGGRAAFVLADVAIKADVRAMVAFADQRFGGLDILVNNAGGAPEQSVPPPLELIQPKEIAELVVMFVRDDSLGGRVVVWPDGERWQLVPDDALYRY
ncbi:MAG: SDR family NAD(P)-dependent oxidoreductase [Anaerolineae bacterium]